MAQRYRPGPAHERMKIGGCPECGGAPEMHETDVRFWVRNGCDLTPDGVCDRIAQYEADKTTDGGAR